jgi:hypothetical protein
MTVIAPDYSVYVIAAETNKSPILALKVEKNGSDSKTGLNLTFGGSGTLLGRQAAQTRH